MTRILARNGQVIEYRWLLLLENNKLDSQWHARIVGERLTNCGKEFPLFQNQLDEPDLTKADRCQGCALVLFNIKAVAGDVDLSRIPDEFKGQ